MHGLKRGRDEDADQPALSKFARREYATDVSSASRIPHILAPGTVLPLWGLGDADGVLGYITVDDNKIDIGGSAFIVGGKTADGLKVALKVFTTPMHDHQVTLIRRELATVRKLAPHPNILSFLGTCPHQNAVLVSPLMCNGNLLRYLERNPATDRHKLVVQVAEALCHVHDVLKLIHGDLKCENVLISDEGNALLADFGLSTAIEKAASDVTTVSDIRQKSTFRFNAPELMLDEVEEVDDSGRLRIRSKTMATDIYAFGMLVLQAFTSQRPWPHYRHEMQIIAAVCNKRRTHPRPDAQSAAVAAGFTDRHWDVCSSCWNFESHDRPKIRHVLSALMLPTTREDTMSSVQALKYDPTSSRPERNEAITSERAAYSRQPASLHFQQPGPSSLPVSPAYFAAKFQSGELQAAYARITRPLYEGMHVQYLAQRGIDINSSKRVVRLDGRVVDLFELHQAHFHAQGIGRQLPDDMWQLLAGKIGFGHRPDNLRSTMSTAHAIKDIYEHYLREFDVTLAQKLLVSNYQLPGGGGLPPGGVPPQNGYAPSPQPGQPPQVQQLHGGPPFVPPPPQGAVDPQDYGQLLAQQLERFIQGIDASEPAAMGQMTQMEAALLQHQHQHPVGQPGQSQMVMSLPGPPQTQWQQYAYGQLQPPFEQPQQQSSFGPTPILPGNAPLNAISHQQMTSFAASQNSRPAQIVPIQELGEWRAMFEKLLTVCKDVDVLLPYAYKIQPDQHVAKMLIDIKLAAREQQQHYITPLSSTHQRVFIDTKVLQRWIAFVSNWTLKARALFQAYQQQHSMQPHQLPLQNLLAIGGPLTQAPPSGGLNHPIHIRDFSNSLDSLDLPLVAGPSSPKTSAANNGDWAFDFTAYDNDEEASKANTPDLVQSVDLDPWQSAVEPADDHAPGNGLGDDRPPLKGPVGVQEPVRDPLGFDRYLSLKELELAAGPESAYCTPGLVKLGEPLVNDGFA